MTLNWFVTNEYIDKLYAFMASLSFFKLLYDAALFKKQNESLLQLWDCFIWFT